MTSAGLVPAFSMASKIEPLPSRSQSTILGIGAQGWWLDVRMTNEARGLSRFLLCSSFWNCSSVNWSGMVDQLNFGPW